MKDIIRAAERVIISFSEKVPLEVFIFFGSIIEEIFAPLPSPLIPATAGAIAAVQEKTFIYLFVLAPIGSLGKTIGAWVVYIVSDKFEDIVLSRFGEKIGITHQEVENFGKKIQKGKSAIFTLFILRSLPVIPSVFLSSASGILKIKPLVFTLATFFGSLIRDFLFLYFGYAGIALFGKVIKGITDTETFLQIAVFFVLIVFVAFIYFRKKNKTAREKKL